jgi:dethiobiotin synthetase/adenosylmethionine--8-amino-7-oxononanoate aminotransferase
MEREGAWDWAKTTEVSVAPNSQQAPWSVWSPGFVNRLSRQTDRVAGVWALGSVLAISMRAQDGVGYNSKAAAKCQTLLREGTESWNVHSRVLGNVLYIMTGQKTDREAVSELEALLARVIMS